MRKKVVGITIYNTAIVKNLNINVSYYNNATTAYVRTAALAYENKGTIENVYVNALVPTPGQPHGSSAYEKFAKAGLVIVNSGTINNTIVNMTYTGSSVEHLNGICAADNGTLKNTAFISNNAEINLVNSGATDDNVNTYESVDAFVDGYDNFVSEGFAGSNYPLKKVMLSDVNYEYFANEATDLTISGISGTVANVKLGGEEIVFTDNSGSVIIISSVMEGKNGKNEFVITTDTSIYTVTVNVLKKNKISTAAEFKAISSGTTEYYVLTSDINLGQYNLGSGVIFAGVLDGNGHTMTYSYGDSHDRVLFGTISGTVKNLIVNVSFFDGNKVRSAALAQTNSGTIENVYVNVTANQPGQVKNATYGKAGVVMTNSGEINNGVVVIHYTGTTAIDGKLNAVAVANTGTVTNTAVITVVDNASAGTIPTGVTGTNVVTYTSLTAFAKDLENFKSAGYTGTLYPKVNFISTVAEFVDIEKDMTGYYVLANDLSIYSGGGDSSNLRFNKPLGFVQSNTNPGTNKSFTGTLDGDGHTLTYKYSWGGPGGNNHDKSLFYIIGATGVVKNLCLNVTEGVGGNTSRTAALAWINNGTIENVYTKISFSRNTGGSNESYGAAGLVVSNYGAINNCIVDYSHSLSSEMMPAAVVAMNNQGGSITNTAAIITSSATINYQNVNNGTKKNTPIYTSYSAFYAAKNDFVLNGFVVDDFWNIGENSIIFGK